MRRRTEGDDSRGAGTRFPVVATTGRRAARRPLLVGEATPAGRDPVRYASAPDLTDVTDPDALVLWAAQGYAWCLRAAHGPAWLLRRLLALAADLAGPVLAVVAFCCGLAALHGGEFDVGGGMIFCSLVASVFYAAWAFGEGWYERWRRDGFGYGAVRRSWVDPASAAFDARPHRRLDPGSHDDREVRAWLMTDRVRDLVGSHDGPGWAGRVPPCLAGVVRAAYTAQMLLAAGRPGAEVDEAFDAAETMIAAVDAAIAARVLATATLREPDGPADALP